MSDFFRFMWEDWIGRCILIGLPLLGGLMIWAIIEDGRQWAAFKDKHNCKVIGKMRGDMVTTVAPIIGGNGGVAVGMSSTPDKTAWQCDDGITYWR